MKHLFTQSVRFILLFSFLTVGGYAFSQSSLAQEAEVRSITISPLTFELTANPGEQISNKIRITNSGPQPIFVTMDAEDFTAVGETGAVVVQDTENSTFSLAQWVKLSEDQFTLSPNEQKIVDFTITVPVDGEPGGHYGSILAVASPPDVLGGSGISQKVGSLVLLSVAGEVNEELSVAEFSAKKFYEKPPVDFTLRFANNGSVHVRPRGFVSITNMFGRKEIDLSFPQKNVLPNSVRKLEVAWEPNLAIGKYTATLVANYGTENTPLTAVISFWVFPWKLALLLLVVLLLISMILIRSRRRLRLAFRVLFKGDKF